MTSKVSAEVLLLPRIRANWRLPGHARKKYGAGKSTVHQNDRMSGANSKFTVPRTNTQFLVRLEPKVSREPREPRERDRGNAETRWLGQNYSKENVTGAPHSS